MVEEGLTMTLCGGWECLRPRESRGPSGLTLVAHAEGLTLTGPVTGLIEQFLCWSEERLQAQIGLLSLTKYRNQRSEKLQFGEPRPQGLQHLLEVRIFLNLTDK